MYRRKFIKLSGGVICGSMFRSFALGRSFSQPVSFAICTDVHKDLIPDADERLSGFIAECNKRKPDFIVQLGDFCTPKAENRVFLEIFNSFRGPAYHVIGNHDMDGGFRKEDTVAYYGMPGRYYSYDQNQFHFVVMDGTVGPYPWTPDKEQLSWLKADLAETNLPTIVFIHQPLEDAGSLSNAGEIRAILEQVDKSGNQKVIACFEGHRHMDYMKVVGSIPYFQINSMSYFWLGSRYVRQPADEEIDKRYPAMKYFSRYQDSLFCFVRISRDGIIEVEGRSSVFMDGTPAGRGYVFNETTPATAITASITDRRFSIGR